MRLLARRYRRCAGRGQCAPEPRAHSLRIPCARSRGAGGARPGAGGRYDPGSPKALPRGGSPGRAAGRGRERRAALASAVQNLRRQSPSRGSVPRPGSTACFLRLLLGVGKSPEFSPPPQTAIQINNPPNNLIYRSSPPACLPP